MVQRLSVQTQGKGLYDITTEVGRIVAASGVRHGLCTLFLQHTSASLTIQENADPAVHRDLQAWMERLVPEQDPLYTHTAEGADDMPSHIRTALSSTSVSIPIVDGKLGLGTWQGLYVWEHRRGAKTRQCLIHVGP